MKTDRQIKALLLVIAVGLLMNALNPWLRTEPVFASGGQADLPAMEIYLRNMDTALSDSLDDMERSLDRLVQLAEGPARGQGRCVWTVIDDSGIPELGQDGEVALSSDWEEVSRAGFMLRAVHDDWYIFERCG